MKTIFNLVAIIAIANLLIIGGLVAALMLSGRLNTESATTIASVLRGEKMVPATQPTTTAPTTQPGKKGGALSSETAVEIELTQLEQKEKAVEHRYARLKDAELRLLQDRELLKQKQDLFNKQVKIQHESAEDKGFANALALYTKMPPEVAKEDFMKLDIDIVVRYLMNMPVRTSTKILEEFKTPAEQAKRQDITERIRTQQALLSANEPKGENP